MADLAVIILTYNEEIHLARALDSVQHISREIFVIDSYSSDRTVEIARERNCVVLQNKFINYAKQFDWALAHAPITSAWVMRLDADEVVQPDLAREIDDRLPKLDPVVKGVNLKRKHIFMGKWIRFGGRYPLILLRIWRNGMAQIEDRWMDEHMVLSSGVAVTFRGSFSDCNLKDLSFFTAKHNSYATREAIDVLNRKWRLFDQQYQMSSLNSPRQAKVKRWIKESIYNFTPFYLSAVLYFIYRFVFQLGFLDGRSGLVYHVLQGFWYRFLVGAKVIELERAISKLSDRREICIEISRLTGHNLGMSESQANENRR